MTTGTEGVVNFLELTTPSVPVVTIQDISDYERHEAERTLLAQLDFGKRAADERGTLTTEQVRGIFAERFV